MSIVEQIDNYTGSITVMPETDSGNIEAMVSTIKAKKAEGKFLFSTTEEGKELFEKHSKMWEGSKP